MTSKSTKCGIVRHFISAGSKMTHFRQQRYNFYFRRIRFLLDEMANYIQLSSVIAQKFQYCIFSNLEESLIPLNLKLRTHLKYFSKYLKNAMKSGITQEVRFSITASICNTLRCTTTSYNSLTTTN
ncbi:hypothetical protein BpHYR1_005518 [Brachionus plicatilis]|uniref:Uncharacterized protein n=1 Tax=Brachionus plicatilis TaxID=10195 RepID=A0A3M7SES1_BRAPC|nr:hypothetical protein BpHYR1_005518 [Brachionus plicatilis]